MEVVLPVPLRAVRFRLCQRGRHATAVYAGSAVQTARAADERVPGGQPLARARALGRAHDGPGE